MLSVGRTELDELDVIFLMVLWEIEFRDAEQQEPVFSDLKVFDFI
tara:strand:- start:215 stop:349 length:135 start_codon:yes stop_codon:yes gene_type:complete